MCEAYSHFGKPYDFNFDFVTDSALVCTELVYKAYQSSNVKKGILFKLTPHAGRKLLTANSLVKTFDEQYQSPGQKLDFVGFLDYDPVKGRVENTTVNAFRKSWERPKWDILLE